MTETTPDWISEERLGKLLEAYVERAEAAVKARIQSQGIVLTGELLGSFRTYAAERAEGYVQARLTMVGYARIKDLRKMNYSRTPPLAALEYFVEKTGIGKFNVPGYKHGSRPASEAEAIKRVAWGIKMNRQRHPNVKREYRGIYSDPLMTEVLPNLFRDLAEEVRRTAVLAAQALFTN